MYCIIRGNVIDGLEITGPFNTSEEANEFSDNYLGDFFVIATMVNPNSEDFQ